MTPTFAQEATHNGKSLITSYQASLLLSANQERASKKPAPTLAEAVKRTNHLQALVMAARDEAFQKCPPGLTGLAQDLALHDDGIFTAEQTIKSMRERLGIVVTPESLELGELQRALYLGHFHGTASEPDPRFSPVVCKPN
jgi:hypothetical protein